ELPSRNGTRQDPGEQRDRRGKRYHPSVEWLRERGGVWQEKRANQRSSPQCDEKRGDSSRDRKHETFDQNLSRQPPPPGTEREPDRYLALALQRPGEQQVRHIRTRDKEHNDRDGREPDRDLGVLRHLG